MMKANGFLQSQCFVKRRYNPIFTDDNQPKLLYMSMVEPMQSIHPRILHAHKEHIEVILIKEGESTYLIDNKQYSVKKGDLLIFNPGVIHDEISGPDNKLGSCCLAVGDLRMKGLPDNFLISEGAGFVFPTGKHFDQLLTIAQLMFDSLSSDEEQTELFCTSLLHAFLTKVFLVVKENTSEKDAHPDKASGVDVTNMDALGRTIKEYIDAHYMEQITLQSISTELFISPYYMSHLFKNMSGYSPMQYMLRRRIGEAQTLLINTSLSLADIAEKVGFESQSYFNYQFTKNVGISPKKYRDNYVIHSTKENIKGKKE